MFDIRIPIPPMGNLASEPAVLYSTLGLAQTDYKDRLGAGIPTHWDV